MKSGKDSDSIRYLPNAKDPNSIYMKCGFDGLKWLLVSHSDLIGSMLVETAQHLRLELHKGDFVTGLPFSDSRS